MHSLKPNRVFERVVQKIRHDVASGKLGSGDKLPTESQLTKDFGIGRGSIREAIRALELFGLVTVRRGREGGVFLTSDCQKLAQKTFSITPPRRTTLEESLEFRKAIEPMAAGLAAIRAGAEDLARIKESLVILNEGNCTKEKFAEANLMFHSALARATRNTYFEDVIHQFLLKDEVFEASRSSLPEEKSSAAYFHRRIARAVYQKNKESAEAWMLAHLIQIAEGSKITEDEIADIDP